VCADGSEEEGRDGRVHHGAPRGQGVGGGSGGSADDESVCLHGGKQLIVTEEVQIREEGGRSTVNDGFVQHMVGA